MLTLSTTRHFQIGCRSPARWLFLLLTGLLLSACATAHPFRSSDPSASLRAELASTARAEQLPALTWTELRAARENPELIDRRPEVRLPFDVTPEIREFARSQTANATGPRHKIAALVDGIFSLGEIEQVYEISHSHTAASMLTIRRGNCFSFSNLLVASARALGLDAFYMDATLHRSSVHHDGDQLVYSHHIVAAVMLNNEVMIVDFSQIDHGDNPRYRRISDREITALFLNNLGHEAQKQGLEPAPYYRAAIRILPTLEPAWNNLATLYMRQGDFQMAETILNESIARGVTSFTPYFNLGLLSMKRGDYPAAIPQFHKALLRTPGNPFLLYNMGITYMKVGKPTLARWAFKLALELDSSMEGARGKLKGLKG